METDMAHSIWHDRAVAAVKKHKVPGSNNADQPMRTAAAAGDWPKTYDDVPEAGYFRLRAAPGKDIWLPVRIYYVLRCEVGRFHASPYEEWLNCCKHPITRDEWEQLRGIKSTLKIGDRNASV